MTASTIRKRVVTSPIGALRLVADDHALMAVSWTDEAPDAMVGDEVEDVVADGAEAILNDAATQLAEYFAGTRRSFTLPTRADGTAFRRRVWAAMLDIPYGQTSTYGDVARAIGSAPRAVGGACGANPLPIIVPCHRVLSGQGIGGYSGFGGLDTKRFLLAHERRWTNAPATE